MRSNILMEKVLGFRPCVPGFETTLSPTLNYCNRFEPLPLPLIVIKKKHLVDLFLQFNRNKAKIPNPFFSN